MRRALRPLLPALSRHFGITGEDVVSMPFAEVSAYIDALSDLIRKGVTDGR